MIYGIFHHPEHFSIHSGLFPLVTALGAEAVTYHFTWNRLQRVSWSVGECLRRWGVRYYGSAWNALVPCVDERRLARRIRARKDDIVHFMWAEFASPRRPDLFSAKGASIVGTFHCSARRQHAVLGRYRCLSSFHRISVMSETQRSFFIQQGYPAERIDITFHGVDTDYFCPALQPAPPPDLLRLLLVGSTERDHEFAAAVMRGLAGHPARLRVLTASEYHGGYAGLPNVEMVSGLTDQALTDEYRNSDLLFMPMLDCTANNAVLEAMSCGTPVMINAVGGVPEYVTGSCNFVMPDKNLDHWIMMLRDFAGDLTGLARRRPAVRQWAERFSWTLVKGQYAEFYRRARAD
jgi:glycosyltransferase involved in cell wall biosynthesis